MSETIAYTVAEACRVSGIGRTSLYQAIKNGKLKALKRGRRTLILAEDLISGLKSQPSMQTNSISGKAPSRG